MTTRGSRSLVREIGSKEAATIVSARAKTQKAKGRTETGGSLDGGGEEMYERLVVVFRKQAKELVEVKERLEEERAEAREI